MSAPASLVIAKLMLPESATPETGSDLTVAASGESVNVLDALVRGTLDGVRLAVNVAAMLIVFLAFTAMFDALVHAIGGALGVELSLTQILGWLFMPLAFLLGVPTGEVGKVATLLGQKTVFNEFVAYSHLADMLSRDPTWLSERGRLITTYALCGFANFASIGIQVAGYSTLAPERLGDLSRLGPRAMLGGLLATCLVACVAGIVL
jgi:CNT family concentrative nucleoside transporter